MNKCICCRKIAEKFIAESFALTCSFYETCDVHKFERNESPSCLDVSFSRIRHFAEFCCKVFNFNVRHAAIGFNRCEGIICDEDIDKRCRFEEGALSSIGTSDKAD